MLNNIHDLLLASVKQSEEEPYYEVLQWAATDGTQYIDTEFIADQNSKIEIGLNILDSGTAVKAVFGSRKWNGSTVSQAFYFYKINGTTVQVGWGNQSKNIVLDTSAEIVYPMRLIIDKGSVTLVTNTKTYTETFTAETFETSTSLIIGTCRTGSSGTELDNRPASVDVRYCRLWNNETLVIDYKPALDDKMQPCLYSSLCKSFLYAKKISDNTTAYDLTFKRWNKFDVDYIENTGTSYIALSDITPSTTMGMNIEYAYTTLSSSEPAGVIGTYNGDTQRKDTFFVSTSSGSTEKASSPSSASCGVMVFHRGGNVGTSSATSTSYIEPEKDVWYKATVNWLGDGEIYWTNGTADLQASVGANTVLTNGLRVFSRCSSSNNTYNNCKSRVRKLQFSDGSTIIRDYQPVVWHSNNTTAIATLYDKVYNKMLTPTGSLKAYIIYETKAYDLSKHATMDINGFYLAEDGTKTVSSDGTSCYTNAISVKEGDIIEWTVTAEAVAANKRIHGYTTNADITTGEKGSWVSMLGKIVFSTTSETTQTLRITIPSGINYIRLSHANVRESQDDIIRTRSYEVGKSVSGTPSSSVSDASNCFDTELYGTQDTTIKYIAIAYDNNSTSGQLFGSYDGTLATSQNLTINSTGTSGNTAPIRFDGKVITTPIRIATDKSASIVNSKYGLWVNDSLHGSWGSVSDFTTTTTLLILKCNNSTNTRNNGCGYCLILDKDETVAEYIPVKNGSAIGLYDKVSKTVNTGVGTINFNALD